MPLATPTFTLDALNNGFIRLTITNPDTAPDRNEVWRSTTTEYDGLPIRISSTLQVNGTFTDYNIASGVSYVYFIRAISGSSTLDSVTAQGSVTLPRATLHACTKQYGSTNKLPSVPMLAVFDVEQHTRPFTRAVTEYLSAGMLITKPTTGISAIEEAAVNFTARLRIQDQYDIRTLKALNNCGAYVCYRDPGGTKLIGTMAEYNAQPPAPYTDVIITINRADFDEEL